MSKSLFFFCASVALMQTVYAQCINRYISQPQIVASSPILSSGSCGCGNNLLLSNGVVGAGAGSFGCGSSLLAPGILDSNDILSISSVSYTTPNGFTINANNLEVGGPVTVYGSLPFAGGVGLSGAFPSGGQATVQYSTAPGVGLTSAGCGQGIAGNAVVGAPGLSACENNAILSSNLLAGNVAGLRYSSTRG